MFLFKKMHWVHHANRIQDDLRKSWVFCLKILHMLRLGSTCMIIYVYVYKYEIEYRANIKI